MQAATASTVIYQLPTNVSRLGEALHREFKRDVITVTTLCPGMSETGFASSAQQKITPALKQLIMQPAPVVQAVIRALQAYCIKG